MPPIFKALAFFAVPLTVGKNPPTNFSISVEFVGADKFTPDRIVSNPEIKILGVNESLLKIITGISAI
jgi:hypothetical protein